MGFYFLQSVQFNFTIGENLLSIFISYWANFIADTDVVTAVKQDVDGTFNEDSRYGVDQVLGTHQLTVRVEWYFLLTS